MAQFITTRPILDLCLQAKRRPGARVAKQWWEQKGVDLAGVWEEAATEIPEEAEGSDHNKTL